MKKLESLVARFDSMFYWFTAISIGAMTLLIFLQVLLRYVLNTPLAWTEEISRYLFIWMTFTAGYVGLRRGKHIGVEALQNALPPVLGNMLRFLANLVSSLFFGAIIYYILVFWQKLSIQTSPATGIPITFVYLGMVIGSLFMCIWYLLLAFKVYTDRTPAVPIADSEVGVE